MSEKYYLKLDIRSTQNAGIYHVAAQHYFSQPYPITNCVPRGSAPGPRWGTLTFSRYALVFLSTHFQTTKTAV